MARITNAEDSAVAQTATGKSGATVTAVTLAGGTALVAPTTGTHVKGEFVLSDDGGGWYCTVAGTPGTWVRLLNDQYAALRDVYPSAPSEVISSRVTGDSVSRFFVTADGHVWFGDGTGALDSYLTRTSSGVISSAVAFAGQYIQATGLTGATAIPLTLGGGTVSGPPVSGFHIAGEIVADNSGTIWYCKTAGTSGTWVASGGGTQRTFAYWAA